MPTIEIGNSFIESKFVDLQRKILDFLAKSLHSVRLVVRTLGVNALEDYCKNGPNEEIIEQIRGLEGYL